MAFSARDFSVLAYANGFTLWHYRTGDALAGILGLAEDPPPVAANDNAGKRGCGSYFAPASEMLRAGDEIKINLIGPAGMDMAHLVIAKISPAGAVELRLIGASLPRPMNAADAA